MKSVLIAVFLLAIQCGFRKQRSTTDHLVRLESFIRDAFIKKEHLKCDACSEDDDGDSGCWYTLWYIWFVLGLFVVVTAVIVVLYIQHRTKERSRTRRRRRSTRTVPIHIVPTGPPAYTEPSQKPPSYEEAMRHSVQHVPGGVVTFGDDYGYQPPPTSMRIVPNSPSQQPPSYAASTQSQGHSLPT